MSTRRLSAILFADAVGFTARAATDETAALRALSAAFEVLETVTGLHGGRVVKRVGDGLLAEFPSVVNAVDAAAAIQARLSERDRDLPPEGRFQFRIGVHVGDIVADGDDILGDGVNVAVRLEAAAEPGGVLISARAHDDVRGKTGLAFDDRGERTLKGLPGPLRVYAVRLGDRPPPPVESPALPDKPSVAVLPFVNMSPEADQEYFVDGLTEDIITGLAAAPGLFVIARNSSFVYKGAAVDVRKVGADLGVRYVLEGSVRRAGQRLRVTGQLIDAGTGTHLWADRMDGTLEDVFALQDRITESVVGAIGPAIQVAEMARAAAKRPDSLTAYDHMLRAMADLNRAKVPQAIEQLDRALALAPAYAKALAIRAWCNTVRPSWSGEVESEAERLEAIAFAHRALEAAPGDPEIDAYAGYTLGFSGDDIGNAMQLVRSAVERCPSFGWGWVSVALLEGLFGDARRALEACDRAERLNPRDPMAFRLHSARVVACWSLLDWEAVLLHGRRCLAASPRISFVRALLVVAAAELGRPDEARAEAGILAAQSPGFSIENHAARVDRMPGITGAPVAAWRRRLAEAGLPA